MLDRLSCYHTCKAVTAIRSRYRYFTLLHESTFGHRRIRGDLRGRTRKPRFSQHITEPVSLSCTGEMLTIFRFVTF